MLRHISLLIARFIITLGWINYFSTLSLVNLGYVGSMYQLWTITEAIRNNFSEDSVKEHKVIVLFLPVIFWSEYILPQITSAAEFFQIEL